MDKGKSLKNNSENEPMDAEVHEEKSDLSSDIGDNRKSDNNDESTDNEVVFDPDYSTFDSCGFGLDLAVLNEVSRIAGMGMSSISFLTSKLSDKELKKMLVAMYSQYSNIVAKVNQHFEKYGEVPDDSPLSSKMMACCGIKMNLMRDKTTSHIAEMMIQGTLMGVIEIQKILNCKLDIDESTTNLLKEFNKFQRENIDKLNAYL